MEVSTYLDGVEIWLAETLWMMVLCSGQRCGSDVLLEQ